MTPSGKITQNTIYLSSAYIVQKILAFVYFALLARFLGADNIGKYTFAISFIAIFSIFIDLGLNSVLTREIAKFKNKARAYIGNVISLKIILSIVTYLIVVLAINLMGYPAQTKNLVYLAGVLMILDSFTVSFYAVLRGFQKIKFEGIGTILNQVVIVILGLIFIKLELPLIFFILVVLIAGVVNFGYAFSLIFFKEKIKFRLTWDAEVIKSLFLIAIPFGMAGIFSRVYSYIDQILLSKLASDADLGIYSVAYKLTFALQFIPAAFGAAIFPAFAELHTKSQEKLKQTFEKALKYLIVFVLPIMVGTIVLAQEIIFVIYGDEFLLSVTPLKILMLSLFFVFINYPLGAFLNACDKQKINTRNIGIAMLVNVFLNIILISKLTFVGSSLAVLGSYLTLVGLNLFVIDGVLKYNKIYLLGVLVKSFLGAFVMGFILHYAKLNIAFWWLIIPGAIIYFIIILGLKVISKNDIISILSILKIKRKNEGFNN